MVVALALAGFSHAGCSEGAEKTAEELLPVAHAPQYSIGERIGMARLIQSGDFNEDGNPDLLILATSSDPEGTRPWRMQVVLLLGDGAAGFHSPQVMLDVAEVLRQGELVWRGLGGIAVGDFDLDSHLDFAVTDAVNEGVWIFWGDRTGGFSATFVKTGDGSALSAIVSGNFSGEGQPELAAIDPLARMIYVFSPAKKRDVFENITTFLLPDNHVPLILAAAGFSGGRYDDLIVLGYKLERSVGAVAFVVVISASGTRGFELRSITYIGDPAPPEPPCLAIGDYDRDGHIDILTVRNQFVFVLWGEKEGFLVRNVYPVPNPLVVQLLLADIDRDDCLDIVLLGMGTQRVWVSSGCYGGTHHMGPVALNRPPCCSVIDDVNGDGIPDLIVATTAWGDWTYIDVFLGKGGIADAGP